MRERLRWARWVLYFLIANQKQIRKRFLQESLDRVKRSPTDWVRRFVTMNETWVHHYTPETKQQSKLWVEAGDSAPKKRNQLNLPERSQPVCFRMHPTFSFDLTSSDFHLCTHLKKIVFRKALRVQLRI